MSSWSSWSSSSDWLDRPVEHQGRSRRWVGCRIQGYVASRVPAHSPAAEKQEQTDDSSSDHGSWSGECPVVKGILLGFLAHCFQLIDQDLSIELAGDLHGESVDHHRDFLIFRLLEKLSQGPGAV